MDRGLTYWEETCVDTQLLSSEDLVIVMRFRRWADIGNPADEAVP